MQILIHNCNLIHGLENSRRIYSLGYINPPCTLRIYIIRYIRRISNLVRSIRKCSPNIERSPGWVLLLKQQGKTGYVWCSHTGSTDSGIGFTVRSVGIIQPVSRPSGHNIHTRCDQIRLNAQIRIGVRTSRAEIGHFIPGLGYSCIITAKGKSKRHIRISNQFSRKRSTLNPRHIKSRYILKAIAEITTAANDTISAVRDTRLI
ncbi:hypothetical protein D3C72_631430 [compost metagenome]